jgi:hypothetical protein
MLLQNTFILLPQVVFLPFRVAHKGVLHTYLVVAATAIIVVIAPIETSDSLVV